MLSLSNNKGGVGKTATAVNLARELARDYSVLLVDLDPQANATAATVENLRRHSFADCVIGGVPVDELIVQGEHFDVLPSHISLERLEIESPAPQAELIGALNDALAPVDDYNFIIIDTLPSLGLLQRMAICAADGVLIPVRASTFAIDGIYNLQQLILTMQRLFGARAELFGIVLTMFDSRKTMCRAIKEALNEEFPDNAFESVIRENTAVDQALSLGQAASDFAIGSAGALDYSTFTAEVIRHVPKNGRPLRISGTVHAPTPVGRSCWPARRTASLTSRRFIPTRTSRGSTWSRKVSRIWPRVSGVLGLSTRSSSTPAGPSLPGSAAIWPARWPGSSTSPCECWNRSTTDSKSL